MISKEFNQLQVKFSIYMFGCHMECGVGCHYQLHYNKSQALMCLCYKELPSLPLPHTHILSATQPHTQHMRLQTHAYKHNCTQNVI